MPEHTARPWVAGRGGIFVTSKSCLWVQVAYCPTSSVFTGDGHYTITRQEAWANARLIAAAPDMLVALEKMVDALIWASGSPSFAPGGEAERGWRRIGKPAIDAGLAAIAKTRGDDR